MISYYLACDLGAESGRLMLGWLQEGRLSLEEIHRFANDPVEVEGALTWNISGLFSELKTGLRRAAARGLEIASISTDSWGVDYLLFDSQGELLAPTYHYRDTRSARGVERVHARIDQDAIFAETGIQFMAINTLFQLAAETPERLKGAHRILGIADGFNYLLSGVDRSEESLASTTQLYNPRTKTWSSLLVNALGLRPELFAPIAPAGTRLGSLRRKVAMETGLNWLEVLASCSHDTGAAVAAVPARSSDWAYLSSGTWSLMGLELSDPVLTERCRRLNFTNEIGFGGTVRLLKNIVGLWIVQECRRHWASRGEHHDYAALTLMAAEAPEFISIINPADPRFLRPDDMPGKISAFCRETGQSIPTTPGAFIRCVLESLAFLYRRTLLELEEVTGKHIERLHIVGGGSKNRLLNQFTANVLQKPVHAGPAEATAMGNLLVQALTIGHLRTLEEARQVVGASTHVEIFLPQAGHEWEQAAARFSSLI